MWEPQLELADAGWRIIAPHYRGMDGANADPAAQSMDDYVADLLDLLDALHVEDAVFGGVSMGGYVAFALLRRAPTYVRALVLADTRPQADTPEGVEGRTRMLHLVGEKGAAGVADEMLPKLVGQTTHRERPDIVARVRELILSSSPEGIAGAIRAMMGRRDSSDLLRTIHVPVLVVAGAEDMITPPETSEQMQRAIAGAQLVVIPQAGHLASLEQPQRFNAALAAFLEHRV
jgi:pimeloyl-ACP methyl ester carboxylesterase